MDRRACLGIRMTVRSNFDRSAELRLCNILCRRLYALTWCFDLCIELRADCLGVFDVP